MAVGLTLLIAVGAAGAFFMGVGRGGEAEVSSAATDVVAPHVDITVVSEPPGATIVADGNERGQTPTVLSLPRGEGPVSIRLELEGYATSTQEVVPDVDQRITASLLPRPEQETSEAATEPTMRRRGRRRLGGRMREPEPAAAETSEPTPGGADERERAFRRFN